MSSSTEELLSPEARAALGEASSMPFSYGMRAYACPSRARVLIVVGEGHFKLARAWQIGKRLVDGFELRGIEGFQARKVFAGRLLGLLLTLTRGVVRVASLGALKGSTIDDAKKAKAGTTVSLEKTPRVSLALHAGAFYLLIYLLTVWGFAVAGLLVWIWPDAYAALFQGALYAVLALEAHLLLLLPAWLMRDRSWSWLLHPLLGILSTRDTLMARGIVRMLDEHPVPNAALVVVGRAHVSGIEDQLVGVYGFHRVELVLIDAAVTRPALAAG